MFIRVELAMNSSGSMFVAFHLPFLGNGYQGPGLSSTSLVCGLVGVFPLVSYKAGVLSLMSSWFPLLSGAERSHTARAELLP